jgi:hypothetical protein
MRAFPPRLTQDLGRFFETLSSNQKFRIQAARSFDAAIERHVQALLKGDESHGHLGELINEAYKDCPSVGVELSQLWMRVLTYKMQAHLLERKINVPRMLQERMARAKKQAHTYVRRII